MTAATLEAERDEKSRRRKADADGEAVAPGDGITELEKFEPERVNGVGTPANGFPVLLLKGVPADEGAAPEPADTAEKADCEPEEDDDEDEDSGDGDEDDSAAKEAESRAAYDTARKEWMGREPAAKSALTGTEYLQQQAAWKRWYAEGDEEGLNGTSDGYARWAAKQAAPAGETPAEDAAEPDLDEDIVKAEAAVYKRNIDTATRRKLAGEGKALPDGCLAPETLVATRRGPQRIDSLVGPCEVLTDAGWTSAEIRSFGIQPLLAVTLQKGKIRQAVHATAGHRWLADDGEWKLTGELVPGDRIPHVEVLGEGVQACGLDAAKSSVAVDAEQTSNDARHMIMVNLERRPHPARLGVSTDRFRDALADGAATALLGDERLEVGVGNAVLSQERGVSPRHPALVGVLNPLVADFCAQDHAEAAVGPAELAGRADVEVGVRTLGLAGTARDRTLVLNEGPSTLPWRPRAIFGLAKSQPADVAGIAPVVRVRAGRQLSAIRAGIRLHVLNATRSRTWEVISVSKTSRHEEVFCAVVPDLYRFVLAGGILTGNSYPIENTGDLDNAAVLARSGHGNVAGAKRLIARRAKELGVSNPLEEKADASKAKNPAGGGKRPPCDTCDGTGKIHDGNMACPDCKGSGKMKSGAAKAAAALLAVQDEVGKAVAAGIISQAAADQILAEAAKARPLPADVKPAGTHREPDGTSTVEQLEPDAGLPTDPDKTPDKVPSSVAAMGKEIPYAVTRMHDATCAAYAADDVLGTYPALKGVADAIDPAWWRQLAAGATLAGETEKAAELALLAADADIAKAADPAAIADGHAFLHKAFTDMYPTEHCSPMAPSAPGKFQRPYISAGHASDMASHKGTVNIPEGHHTPEPEQFQRGPITAGHESPSPANTSGNNRVAPGSPRAARSYYSNAARDQARTALAAMHDHIAASFPDLCPMAASKTVLPPDLGAKNVPQAATPPSQGGIATMKAEGADAGLEPGEAVLPTLNVARGFTISRGELRAGEPLAKQIRKAVRRALREHGAVSQDAATGSVDAAMLGALITEQIAPLTERYDTQLAELRKELGELGSQPDPALAPLRGAIARAPGGAVPVERRSLIDEARQSEVTKAAAEQAAYREYVTALSRSPDPGTREKALAVLDQMSAAVTKAA